MTIALEVYRTVEIPEHNLNIGRYSHFPDDVSTGVKKIENSRLKLISSSDAISCYFKNLSLLYQKYYLFRRCLFSRYFSESYLINWKKKQHVLNKCIAVYSENETFNRFEKTKIHIVDHIFSIALCCQNSDKCISCLRSWC